MFPSHDHAKRSAAGHGFLRTAPRVARFLRIAPPIKALCTFRYSDSCTCGDFGGTLDSAHITFNMNNIRNIYDSSSLNTWTGLQTTDKPAYFDQIAAFYGKYRVTSATIKMHCTNSFGPGDTTENPNMVMGFVSQIDPDGIHSKPTSMDLVLNNHTT